MLINDAFIQNSNFMLNICLNQTSNIVSPAALAYNMMV
jgi:hypothetical protein